MENRIQKLKEKYKDLFHKVSNSVGFLDLNGINKIQKITDENLIVICEALKINSTLKEINISNNLFGDEGTKYLSGYLSMNPSLFLINLSVNDIRQSGMKHLSNALRLNSTLKEIYFFQNRIGDEGVKYLSECLKVNCCLSKINLCHTEINAKGVKYLSEALKINTSLKSINLGSNDFGDEGLNHLSEALKLNNSLTETILFATKIGKIGMKHFLESLQQNNSLKDINISLNNSCVDFPFKIIFDSLRMNSSLTRFIHPFKFLSNNKKTIVEQLVCCNKIWKKEDHKEYSKSFQRTIFSFLCCSKYFENTFHFKLGKFVFIEIIKLVDRKTFLKHEFKKDLEEIEDK